MYNDVIRSLDPLYGEIAFKGPIADLLRAPVIQRLRDVRLSNIDSIAMPGISNISRYEHVLGAGYLASRVGFFPRLTSVEALILQASALLHDAAIAAFGHLVEEALQYVGVTFVHETKFAALFRGDSEDEVGGLELQLYAGRESGIRRWADRVFGSEAEGALAKILASIGGKGPFGGCIAGGLDVDNLDNLTRIAFHMGLAVDRELPVRIAQAMVRNRDDGVPVFSETAVEAARSWLRLRREVYGRLMLSREDFAGKAMLIAATVRAFEGGDLKPEAYAWTFTDRAIVNRLLGSRDREVKNGVGAWLLRELWPLSDLVWLSGVAPAFGKVYGFGTTLGKVLDRPCFAYRISDKRARRLSLSLDSGQGIDLGEEPKSWVLGVVSSERSAFTVAENGEIRKMAADVFGTECLTADVDDSRSPLPLFTSD